MAPIKRKGNGAEDVTARQPQKRVRVGAEEGKRQQKKRSSHALEASSTKEVGESKASLSSASKASEISVLRDDEPSFPRGGASVLTPLERKQIQIQATKDVLFEQKGSTKQSGDLDDSEGEDDVQVDDENERASVKKPRKKKSKSQKHLEREASEKQGVRVEGLSFKVCTTFYPSLISYP